MINTENFPILSVVKNHFTFSVSDFWIDPVVEGLSVDSSPTSPEYARL